MKESTIDFTWIGVCLMVGITLLYIGMRELIPDFRSALFFAGWMFGIVAMYLPSVIRDVRAERHKR